MKLSVILLVAVISIAVLILCVLGVVAYYMWQLSQGNPSENETNQELEKRLMNEEAASERSKGRVFYEKRCEAKLQDVEDKLSKMRAVEDALRKDYERRFYQHVTIEGQDPDTLDMDPHQRAMRKDIKELRVHVDERAKERRRVRRAQGMEERQERASRAKEKLNSRKYFDYIDGYFGQDNEDSEIHHDGITFDNEQDYLRFILPSKTVRRQEEMARLKRMQVQQANKAKFHEIDMDHSGFIDKKEMRLRVADIVGHPVSEQQLEIMFNVMDTDGNGQIDIYEFLEYCANELEDHSQWWDDPQETLTEGDHDLTEACNLKPERASLSGSVSKVHHPEVAHSSGVKPGEPFHAGAHPTHTPIPRRDRGARGASSPKYSVQVAAPASLMDHDSVKTYVLNKDKHDKRYLADDLKSPVDKVGTASASR
eukprot:TRINITY_DN13189_c0_g2_i3.p1 TRINITY_DN13189_c0_g2~~TRINITY_DN13189_c0_g2_i3.p1  ORF type:complete len:425 (+),score=173.68 TRINITY_DN13189_c0_g2_i3:271-1545(+)